jgi:pyridoxamine 5'-phosphate oxidase
MKDLRTSYTQTGLLESDVSRDPLAQFALWFEQARTAGNPEPNAMALATATADGVPSCRAVLLKSFDARGFVFYTNYESRKGSELSSNPKAALMFWWPELERQVRIGGEVERVSREESEEYFASRPVGHQLGAWASRQSSVVAGRDALDDNLAAAATKFEPGPAPLPPWWGGFRVRPSSFEFWQGRPNRMHDRLEYLRQPDGTWVLRRLAP